MAAEFGPAVEGYTDRNVGRLRQHLKSGIWKIVREHGKESLGTTDLDEAKRQYDDKRGKPVLIHGDWTVARVWQEMEETPGRAKGTIDRYRGCMENYILPVIRKNRPRDTTPEDIVRIYDRMLRIGSARKLKGGKRSGKQLSVSSFDNVETAVQALFTFAMEVPIRCTDHNPVPLARKELDRKLNARAKKMAAAGVVPAKVDPAGKVVSIEEIEAIAAEVAEPYRRSLDEVIYAKQMRVLVLVSPEFGWRIQEALATEISDYERPLSVVGSTNPRPATLRIEWQLGEKIDPLDRSTWRAMLKSATARNMKMRSIGVSPFATRILNAYIDEGIAEGWLKQDGLLFPDLNGAPRCPNYVSRKVKTAAERAGIERTITPHFFRHTFASMQYAAGRELKDVADDMGDDEETVKSTYLHAVEIERRHIGTAAAGRQ